MSILEALASGTPIVASAVGGIPEILQHERNGLLIPPRSVDALADAIERLLDDPVLRDRMSKANRDDARAFAVDLVAASLRSIYRRLLAVNPA
jgi:glycosyltransferase involved in cell wall biosynthesis